MSDVRVRRLARAVGRALLARRLKLATAESCTGGGIGAAVTAIAGSSDWFDRGFITYSNAAKRELLGVRAATLTRHGAVSEPVVAQMARGALKSSDAGVAVSVSGIAGPGGGTKVKPVGTVCFGWALADGAVRCETVRFTGGRDRVRAQSVEHALAGVLALLK